MPRIFDNIEIVLLPALRDSLKVSERADFSVGMLGANGVVGGGLPIAVGAAIAAQLENGNNVAVSFFGDGGCQEGIFHESLNLASIWKLPIVFVCENNLYAANMPANYAIPLKNIADRASAYAIPGIIVDGNDVTAVYDAAKEAVAKARDGQGPSLLECKTYRWDSHNELFPDPRPAQEIAAWKARCPILRMEKSLIDEKISTKEELQEIDKQILAQIEDAVEFAVKSPFPDPRDVMEGVFSE